MKFFKAKHRVPTVAVRISADGKTFAFSADTVACEDIVGCAKNADLFLCDALVCRSRRRGGCGVRLGAMHATAREAAVMATCAGVGALACTHIARFADPANILAEAKTHFWEVIVARDGDRYCI